MANHTNTSPSFHDQLVAHENNRHARRLAEIKHAASKLRMFEPTAAVLAERGINVANDAARTDFRGMLVISRSFITEWDNNIHTALIELGFSEIDRRISGVYANCDLKKGRLRIALMIKVGQDATTPAPVTAAGAA